MPNKYKDYYIIILSIIKDEWTILTTTFHPHHECLRAIVTKSWDILGVTPLPCTTPGHHSPLFRKMPNIPQTSQSQEPASKSCRLKTKKVHPPNVFLTSSEPTMELVTNQPWSLTFSGKLTTRSRAAHSQTWKRHSIVPVNPQISCEPMIIYIFIVTHLLLIQCGLNVFF